MNKQIALMYENGRFHIDINGAEVKSCIHLEEATKLFEQVYRNNVRDSLESWEAIEGLVAEFKDERIEVNSQYKTMSFEGVKYFYNTGSLFYIGEGQMVPIIGEFRFFYALLKLVKSQNIQKSKEISFLCSKLAENHISYSLSETSIFIASAIFNYGSVEYDFSSGKIHKGTVTEKCTFESFKEYVLGIITR